MTRLVGGRKPSEGRLEVLVNDIWGTVCDAKLSWRDSIVVCRELGFPSFVGVTEGAYFGPGTGQILKSNLGCNGSEATIHDCPHKEEGDFECDHSRDSGIICTPMEPLARVADGPYEGAGRLELSFDDGATWGTVCGDKWSWRDRKIACRHLGYDGKYVQDLQDVVPGDETQPILVSELGCSRECPCSDNLLACPHKTENIECDHSQDVGVICTAPESTAPESPAPESSAPESPGLEL